MASYSEATASKESSRNKDDEREQRDILAGHRSHLAHLVMRKPKLKAQRLVLEEESFIERYGYSKKRELADIKKEIERTEEEIKEEVSCIETLEKEVKQAAKIREQKRKNEKEYKETQPEKSLPSEPIKVDTKVPDDQPIGLFFQRLNLENEMIIEGMFPKNFSCTAEPWNSSDDRLSITKEDSFPKCFKFETDFYHIKDSKTDLSLFEETTPCKNMLLKVSLPNSNTREKVYRKYIGASMYHNDWQFIQPISQEGCLVFEVTKVESFCVYSTVAGQSFTIPPDGGKFISTLDDRIQVTFPPGAVKEETTIDFKVHPMDIDCIKQISDEENMGAGLVYEISPGLSASHTEFKKPVLVEMPLKTVPGYSYDETIYVSCVYKMEDEGSFELAPAVVPKIENDKASFEVLSFSRITAGKFTKDQDPKSIGFVLGRAQAITKCCKILCFFGKTEKRHIHILLECVLWNKVKATSKKRKLMGFQLMSDWISKDLYLEPDKTVIAVEIRGKFKLPRESCVKQPIISFMPMARDNYEHVLVELNDKQMATHGILSFFLQKNKFLFEIFYDPARSIKIAPNRQNPTSRANKKQPKKFDDAEFFTDIGLLNLAKLMDENTMFQVCIYMGMSKVDYDNTPMQSGVEKNFTLLQKALKQQQDGTKVQCLIKALYSAGEITLSERVQKMWSAENPIHTISET